MLRVEVPDSLSATSATTDRVFAPTISFSEQLRITSAMRSVRAGAGERSGSIFGQTRRHQCQRLDRLSVVSRAGQLEACLVSRKTDYTSPHDSTGRRASHHHHGAGTPAAMAAVSVAQTFPMARTSRSGPMCSGRHGNTWRNTRSRSRGPGQPMSSTSRSGDESGSNGRPRSLTVNTPTVRRLASSSHREWPSCRPAPVRFSL